MKSLLVLVIAVLIAITIIPKTCCNKAESSFNSDITIAMLKEKQSVYADSLVTLKDVTIEESQSLLNYSKAKITDCSRDKIVLLTNKPFKTGEKATITGRLMVAYQNSDKRVLVFIDENLKPANDILRFVIGSVGI